MQLEQMFKTMEAPQLDMARVGADLNRVLGEERHIRGLFGHSAGGLSFDDRPRQEPGIYSVRTLVIFGSDAPRETVVDIVRAMTLVGDKVTTILRLEDGLLAEYGYFSVGIAFTDETGEEATEFPTGATIASWGETMVRFVLPDLRELWDVGLNMQGAKPCWEKLPFRFVLRPVPAE